MGRKTSRHTEPKHDPDALHPTRGYQQEMLDESLRRNIIIALDTGSGKTHIAVLRLKIEAEREKSKVSWFFAPTVALAEQQHYVISTSLPVSCGLISGALEPDQWHDAKLWQTALSTHRIIVSTPQVLLDALRHGYVNLGKDVGLLVFDEAHHANDKHPYNIIMREFYDRCPVRKGDVSAGSGDGTSVEVRPFVLGLTASPIFGGNVDHAFRIIERNLDAIIRAPLQTRAELAQHVHRPEFSHVLYPWIDYRPGQPSESANVRALKAVVDEMNIEEDPYVVSMRAKLARLSIVSPPSSPSTPGGDSSGIAMSPPSSPSNRVSNPAERKRIEQRLSRSLHKNDTYTHKGLRDFLRAAEEICFDLGTWAADWYVARVMQQAGTSLDPNAKVSLEDVDEANEAAATPMPLLVPPEWQNKEKAYLLGILSKVAVTNVSYDPRDIEAATSPKTTALIKCLLSEKAKWDTAGDVYSGLVFVTRRDTVLALSELLFHHPLTKDVFIAGCLLGSSESTKRHAFLDITRALLRNSQTETLSDFRIGETNLLISTSVAEEGIDIQGCGSVVRWDVPPNMVSWAQSRGRARKQRSSFVVMFEDGGVHEKLVEKWANLEREMVEKYRAERPSMEDNSESDDGDDGDKPLEFRIQETGALVTLNSAVSHLAHFCSVIPFSSHVAHDPIYDIDPPDYPEGYHSRPPGSMELQAYMGPFGCTVTLPKLLPHDLRVYTVDVKYPTKRSARRHAAFKAYTTLYDVGLLNEHLLPLSSAIMPDMTKEIQALLKDIEKREGLADVTEQMRVWERDGDAKSNNVEELTEAGWYATKISIEGVSPAMKMFTRVEISALSEPEMLYDDERGARKVRIQPYSPPAVSTEDIRRAEEFTRTMFFMVYGNRMSWDDTSFTHLFLPTDESKDATWARRRDWAEKQAPVGRSKGVWDRLFANARKFGEHFKYPSEVSAVADRNYKLFRFVEWRLQHLSPDEMERIADYDPELEYDVEYPIIVAEAIPPRANFLVPRTKSKKDHVFLLPERVTMVMASAQQIQFALFTPSLLRALEISITSFMLRTTLLADTSLSELPISQLRVAHVAPSSQELYNYQRLETLGDTILKFVVSIQLFSQYPLWHEGYLTRRKEHVVSNSYLAHGAVRKGLYRWIVRNRFVPKKWKPAYRQVSTLASAPVDGVPKDEEDSGGEANATIKTDKSVTQLSTKVLADVVEALIGASYVYGGFDRSIDCIKVFDLGMSLDPLQQCVTTARNRVEELPAEDLPPQISYVENILGYEFKTKTFLVEALMHASCQNDLRTVSYERMEFLGDSVLDMVVTELFYNAPGKNYSPGNLHLRKSAVVNSHFLGYICLRSNTDVETRMPKADGHGKVTVTTTKQKIYLSQCLLHSSSRILEDQANTLARFHRSKEEIDHGLRHKSIYPWAALTKLQAPKFFSDIIESIIGAIYLDSNGDFEIVRRVLERLDVLPILRRIIEDDVDVRHPVSRVANWAAANNVIPEYRFEKADGFITCTLRIDDGLDEREVASATERFRGKASENEVKFRAAEEGIEVLTRGFDDYDLYDEDFDREDYDF